MGFMGFFWHLQGRGSPLASVEVLVRRLARDQACDIPEQRAECWFTANVHQEWKWNDLPLAHGQGHRGGTEPRPIELQSLCSYFSMKTGLPSR